VLAHGRRRCALTFVTSGFPARGPFYFFRLASSLYSFVFLALGGGTASAVFGRGSSMSRRRCSCLYFVVYLWLVGSPFPPPSLVFRRCGLGFRGGACTPCFVVCGVGLRFMFGFLLCGFMIGGRCGVVLFGFGISFEAVTHWGGRGSAILFWSRCVPSEVSCCIFRGFGG